MKGKPSPRSRPRAPEEASYEIGYGKPPKNTRFKPGQSGNPRGRPRGQRNLRTAVRDALEEKVIIREGDRTRSVPRMDAIIRVTFNNALRGDAKAVAAFIQLVRSIGLMDEEPESSSAESIRADDKAILAGFFERCGVKLNALDGEGHPAEAEAAARTGSEVKMAGEEEPEDKT